jgi:mono/diheme cytochrome c family protein
MTVRSTTVALTSLMVMLAIAAPAPVAGHAERARWQASAVDGSVYGAYCASCHGQYGRGNGPAAAALKRRPADLTRITKRNKGVFPAERVYQIIDGRHIVTAHGDSQMPVWGDAFSKAMVGSDEASIKAKIEALVRHLESIQER